MIFGKFIYREAARAETKGAMGKFDPNIGGVGMGPGTGAGVAALLWPCDATWCFGALVLWCLVLWCFGVVFHFLGGGQTILGL